MGKGAARLLVCVLVAFPFVVSGAALPEVSELPARDALPDPLIGFDGAVVDSPEWPARRDEIVDLLLHYEYGHMPAGPERAVAVDVTDSPALDGAATMRHFRLRMGNEGAFAFGAGVLIPTKGNGPFPVILAIDPVFQPHVIPIATQVIDRGYAFAGFVYLDVDNDNADRSDGVYPHYPGNDWGTIAAWAWAAMRVVDYLQTMPEIDSSRIVITGHSRCGKAALLAGALDTRIAVVAPHSSGAGGSGSYRMPQQGCETLADITDPTRFHYWFHPRLREFAGHEDRLPFDQHFLMALVAPRHLFSLETRDDAWSNPEGAARMLEAARPVFRLLEAPTHATLYMRPGGHDTTSGDWDALLGYADRAFR